MPQSPPVLIKDGSLIIETDEPIDLDANTVKECDPARLPDRPYKYKRRNSGKNIGRVIVRQGEKVVCDEFFQPRECTIEIFWSGEETEAKAQKD